MKLVNFSTRNNGLSVIFAVSVVKVDYCYAGVCCFVVGYFFQDISFVGSLVMGALVVCCGVTIIGKPFRNVASCVLLPVNFGRIFSPTRPYGVVI